MEHEPEPDPRPLILRRFIWDIFPHDYDVIREVQGNLGLVPDHDDGMDVEHHASDKRIGKALPLEDTLDVLSEYAAEVLTQYMVESVREHAGGDFEVPDEVREGFEAQNAEILSEGLFAVIAHLMDTGVLVYGPKIQKVLEAAGDGS